MHGLNKPKGMGKLTAENQLVTRTNFLLFSIANPLAPEKYKTLSKIRYFKYVKYLTVFILLLKSKHFLTPIGNNEVRGGFFLWFVFIFITIVLLC